MIRVEHVRKSYGAREALRGVDLTVAAGERIALVGPNGSGKTTLLRCLLGLLRFDGAIRVDGHDVIGDHAAAQFHVAYVPQRAPALAAPVAELVRFWTSQRGAPADRLATLCARLGLDLASALDKPFTALSGGMQQKLLAAMALGTDCSVLLLDEPTANLDPQAREVFFELLMSREPAPTVLLSSHRLDEIARIVTRVVVLAEGSVAFDDGLEAFLTDADRAAAAGVDLAANIVPFRRNA